MKFDWLLCVLLALASLGGGCRKGPAEAEMSLHRAAAAGDLARVRELLSDGADVDVRDDEGRTPLHAVIREQMWEWRVGKVGEKSMVQLLVAAGADIDAPDANGATPLHHAAFLGHARAVKQLLAAGANVNAKNHRGETPLHRAILSGSGEIIERLVARGADVNAADRDGWTPLHVAAFHRGTRTYDLLVARGANPNTKTNEGKGAADLVREAADRRAILFPSAEKGGPYATIVTDPREVAAFVRAYGLDFDRVWIPGADDLEWTTSVLRTALDAPAGLPAPEGFELEYVRAHLHQYNRQCGGFVRNGRKYLLSNMYLSDSIIEEDASFPTSSSPDEESAPPENTFTMIFDGGAIAVRALFDVGTRTLVHIECNGE